jgi:hypothetical protein
MSYRLRGFLIHLAASVVLALIASGIIFLIWYPSPLEQAIGVASIVLLLLGVDVVAGPLLTLAVCKQGKKSLKYDLAIIVLIQFSAFIYGIHIIAQGRPVWIALHENSFHVVQAYQMHHAYIEKANNNYQNPGIFGPQWVAVRKPNSEEKPSVFEGLMKGVLFIERADLYEPLTDQLVLVKEKSHDLSLLNQFNDSNTVKNILAKWTQADAFLPLNANEMPMTVLVKRNTGEIIAIVNLKPWSRQP